mgnify:CR=1 FL=1
MTRRLLIEVASLLAGLYVAYTIGRLSAWSYPLGARDIWLVTYAAMVAVMVLGLRQTQRAVAEERARGR